MENLQTDLNKIYQWQETNNMQFNGAKFENIRYGQDEDFKNTCDYITPNANVMITRKEHI